MRREQHMNGKNLNRRDKARIEVYKCSLVGEKDVCR